MWEILLKEKGGREGRDHPLGTGTEEEKRKIQREKGRRGRNRQSFACKGTEDMLALLTGAHCKVPKGQGRVCQDANVHCPR